MDAVEVKRDGYELSINQASNFVLERIPLGETGYKVPNGSVVGMKDMGAVVMDADAVFVPVVVAVATDVGALVYDGHTVSLLGEQTGCCSSTDTCSDNEEVLRLHLSSSPISCNTMSLI